MRVGINLLYLLPGIVGGTETYAAGLLLGLTTVDQRDEFVVYVNMEAAAWPLPETPNLTRVVCPVNATSRSQRYIFEQLRLPQLLRKHSIDLVHSLGYVSPVLAACPSVVTIHDLNYQAFGSYMPRVKRLALALMVRLSALQAQHIITVSEFSRREVCRTFGVPRAKVTVTHGAPKPPHRQPTAPPDHEKAVLARLGIRPPYVLAFSSLSPNKNIPRLLAAFNRARNRHGLPHQLVLVGHFERNSVPATALADSSVVLTGYLDSATLEAVLSSAQMLVFPSYYEGFGLPVLEAMAAGVPVVSSSSASLPEVCGEAALFFNPQDVEDMAQKIALVASDPKLREALRQKGLRNVGRYSWEQTAEQTLAVYAQVHQARTTK